MRITKARKMIALVSLVSVAMLVTFQNCSRDFSFNVIAPSAQEFAASSSVMINKGAPFTRQIGVTVQAKAPLASEMYVTNDPTCEAGGSWQSLKDESPWILAQTNSQATVYVGFRTEMGGDLGCLNASILHDDQPPAPAFLRVPTPAITNSTEALHSFTADDKGGSGLDHFECRTNSNAVFLPCADTTSVRDLAEGQQHLFIRAVDRAGNVSDPIENHWLIDLMPPEVTLTAWPEARSAKTSAIFRFEATDAASGVGSLSCALDLKNGAVGVVKKDCTSPMVYSGVGSPDVAEEYSFRIWAYDKAGNQSAIRTLSFLVDRAPSGSFEIVGVSGNEDKNADQWLGSTASPTVSWTESARAVRYGVSILSESGSETICAEERTSGPVLSHSFAANTCTLVDGRKYLARVRAETDLGNLREAAAFKFTVDLSGPTIDITGPARVNDEDKDAEFTFAVADSGIGLASVACVRSRDGAAPGGELETNCADLTKLKYTGLEPGFSYKFKIVAVDKAGNKTTSAEKSWSVHTIVCDPFSNDVNCVKGLKANLFYLTGELQGKLKLVDEYLTQGIKANVSVYMARLFVPSQHFTKGFSTSENSLIRDNDGKVLLEYFALDLQTYVKLGADQPEGKYQFAVLSDDGSVINIKRTASGAWSTLIDNDNYHSTQLGCDLTGVQMTKSTRLPMQIKYFQGPQTHIAAALLWRKFPTDPGLVRDEACGKSGDTEFFGDVTKNPPNMTEYTYGQMIERGWKPLEAVNFISDEPVASSAPTSSSTTP